MAPPPLRIDVLTLFPALFAGFLSQSIVRRAIDKELVAIERWDLRDWAQASTSKWTTGRSGEGREWS